MSPPLGQNTASASYGLVGLIANSGSNKTELMLHSLQFLINSLRHTLLLGTTMKENLQGHSNVGSLPSSRYNWNSHACIDMYGHWLFYVIQKVVQ